MNIQQAEYVVSNVNYRECPAPELPEFAFIGRSNVGKSSLINMLTQRKALAKTSGTPGK
ncbi:GTPase, partial [Persicitalea sp.]|uniref:GTPase n=1 Tax=Persicitalea sp. TaxID=3100273 RepID=UPI003593C00A